MCSRSSPIHQFISVPACGPILNSGPPSIFRCVSCSRPFPLPPCLSLSLHVASCLDTYFGVVCCPPWTVPPSIHPSLLSIHPLTYGLFFIDVVPIHLSTCSCFVPSFNTSPSCWCRTHEIVSLSSSPCRKKPETVQFVVRVCARCLCLFSWWCRDIVSVFLQHKFDFCFVVSSFLVSVIRPASAKCLKLRLIVSPADAHK